VANQIIDVTQAGPAVYILNSASRTATPDTFEIQGIDRYSGLVVVCDVTAITSTPSITVAVQGVDRKSGKTWTILTSAAITATGTTVLKIRPGIAASANVAASDVLPPFTRIAVTHSNSNAITYSVAAYLTN
jgi:hypothetical protein